MMTSRNQLRARMPLLLAGAAAALLVLSACKKQEEKKEIPALPVITAPVTIADVDMHHEYPGSTATIRMVEINARVEGWVVRQHFKDGQMVKEGALLYEIDPRPFEVALEQAEADFGVADAEYRNAKQKVERNRPLVPVEAISAEQFDQLVANERSTKAQTEARAAAVDQARLNLSYCTIRALSSGQVSKTQVYEGTLVGPAVNNKMTNIQVLDPIWVEFYPIAADIAALRKLLDSGAATVGVSLPPGAWKGSGKIVFIDNHVDATTDTILARVELSNKDLSLVPGAYVKVQLPTESLSNAVTIPEAALIYQTAATLVWMAMPDGTAKSQLVEVGPKGGSGVVILKGLKEGDRVIVEGTSKIRADGTKIVEAPPLPKPPEKNTGTTEPAKEPAK